MWLKNLLKICTSCGGTNQFGRHLSDHEKIKLKEKWVKIRSQEAAKNFEIRSTQCRS